MRVRELARFVFALDDAKEGGEERQGAPVYCFDVRVEIPPLGCRGAMRQVVHCEVDGALLRPICKRPCHRLIRVAMRRTGTRFVFESYVCDAAYRVRTIVRTGESLK